MQITEEWLETIKDSQGLTAGQTLLLNEWRRRLAFVGYGYLPDQVAHFLEKCRGYRGITSEERARLNGF